jgi:hypothetical protein
MKRFFEYINESTKKPEKIIKALDRTRKSIDSFVRRNPGHSMNNRRALALMDRYNDLASELMDIDKSEWDKYCKERKMSPLHDGADLFA